MFLRLSSLILLLLSVHQLYAQEPEKKNTALFYKITATWCGPCGSWGWDLANEVQETKEQDILYMAIFNSNQSSMNNTAFYNSTAVTLGFNFRHNGWPSFGVNGINLTDKHQVNSLDIDGIKQECYDSIDAFVNKEVVVNAASQIMLEKDMLKVSTNVKFFENAIGEYYLASYIIEQGAMNYQNQQQGLVAHKGVLRGTLDSLDWGRLIVADSIVEDSMLTYDYAFTLQEQDWETDKLLIYNIIWKKEGSRYKYVNGSQTRVNAATHVKKADPIHELVVYPNPVQHTLHIKGLTTALLPYSIYDITGKLVQQGRISNTQASVDISSLAQGFHIIQFRYADGTTLNRELIKL